MYGVGDAAIKWFESYMEDRWQYVEINGEKSGKIKIDIGCFQGCIAAPLLFIIYINDLVMLQDKSTKCSIYADDNNFKCKLDGDLNENKARIEQKMDEIQTYMNSNRLKLNLDKTKLMIMTTKNKNMHSTGT